MKITLYVDIVSPFAYIAYYVLRHDPVFKKCEVEYIPVFLGGIMKMTGNTAPINIKNKDKWIARERALWARHFGVPMVAETPAGFPPRTLDAMRLVCALGPAQAAVVRALDAFYEAYWARGRAVADAAVEADVLGAILRDGDGDGGGDGGDGGGDQEGARAAAVRAAARTEGRRVLLENTDLAVAEGAFGLPWMVCENDRGEREGFWGCDHFGVVLDFLGIERPRTGAWKAML